MVEASPGMPFEDTVQINVTRAVAAAEFSNGPAGVRDAQPGQVTADLAAITVG